MKKITSSLYIGAIPLFLIMALVTVPSHAQSISDTLALHEINVKATRIKEPVDYQPIQVTIIDSTTLQQYQSQDLGTLLADQSFAFVQSNGPGGLQSISLRGYDARHTQVIWEGFDINHPMVGTTDLSLIPVSALSSVEVSPGNPATSFGAGSSGGIIYLRTDNFINKVQLTSSLGSFGYNRQNMAIGTKQKNWKITIMAGRKNAEENFPYFNTKTNKWTKRQNNALYAHHLLTNIEWSGKRHFIKTALWYNYQNNHIANAIDYNTGKGIQRDNSLRWYGIFGGDKGQTHYQVKAYYSHYNLKYDDNVLKTHSRSLAKRYVLEAKGRHYFTRNFDLSGLLSIQNENVKTNNYAHREHRTRLSALVHGEYRPVKGLRIYPALRLDSYSDFGNQLSPALGANYEIISGKLFLRGQIKRDFTAPTFNQLYWQPGGNPDLKPEKSWTSEAGFTFRTDITSVLALKIMPSYFNSNQQNGIRWEPGKNGIWSPVNFLSLHMHGAEMEAELMYQHKGLLITLHNYTDWTKAGITKSDNPNANDLHKQLSYVPEWSFKTDLTVSKGPVSFYINQSRIGSRYTTNSHTSPIDPLAAYNIINSGIVLSHQFGKFGLSVHVKMLNVFNKKYQVVAWYPMPGRNYIGSVNLSMGL